MIIIPIVRTFIWGIAPVTVTGQVGKESVRVSQLIISIANEGKDRVAQYDWPAHL